MSRRRIIQTIFDLKDQLSNSGTCIEDILYQNKNDQETSYQIVEYE